MENITFNIDVNKAWEQMLQIEMSRMGLKASTKRSYSEQYYQFLDRCIPIKPRKVKYSKDFTDKRRDPRISVGIERLLDSVRRGDDLLPYQSEKILKTDYSDDMYIDWNIQHFHLGAEKKGVFIDRTGPLIYAVVTEDCFYIIDILDHGFWAKPTLLTKAYYSWPELFPESIMKDYSMTLDNEKDINLFRKFNINCPVYEVMPGVIIEAPNVRGRISGRNSAGSSIMVSWGIITANRILQDIEKEIELRVARELQNTIPFFVKHLEKNEIEYKINVDINDVQLRMLKHMPDQNSYDYSFTWWFENK